MKEFKVNEKSIQVVPVRTKDIPDLRKAYIDHVSLIDSTDKKKSNAASLNLLKAALSNSKIVDVEISKIYDEIDEDTFWDLVIFSAGKAVGTVIQTTLASLPNLVSLLKEAPK